VPRASQALEYLRGYVVVMVIAFHAFMAYMAFLPQAQTPFDMPPYDWIAHPIIDRHRWLGFDLFGAFQFLHLMQLMCFLSGLFVWQSLMRKGAAAFALDRMLRLGVPFVLGVYLLMPLAYYPAYAASAADPGWSAFRAHWLELPFWPCGPLWFLAFILALNLATAALWRLAPAQSQALLGRLSSFAGDHPVRFVLGLIAVSALAYFPMAAHFPPWRWVSFGPFSLQVSFSLQYVVYFLAGLAVGAGGIARGFFATDTLLARHWARWLAGILAAFVIWIIPAAIITKSGDGGSPLLPALRESGLVLFAACAAFGSMATSLRFVTTPRPILKSIADNAYGIYLFHYFFVIWTQYALLTIELPAVVKGLTVFVVTLSASWAVSAALNSLPLGARLMRGSRRTGAAAKPGAFAERRGATARASE